MLFNSLNIYCDDKSSSSDHDNILKSDNPAETLDNSSNCNGVNRKSLNNCKL